MAKFKMDDGNTMIVDTNRAKSKWNEATDWNGNNHISKNTGSQWDHETLYESAKGRFYLTTSSDRQGTMPRAWLVTDEEAAAWIVLNDGELPESLKPSANAVTE